MKFRHNQKVEIINGFWKRKIGRIRDFKENKDGDITYIIGLVIDDKETTKEIKERDLKATLF